MEIANVLDERLHRATDSVNIPVLVAQHTCVLAVRCVALDHKTLSKDKLARLHDLFLIALLLDRNWRALANLPEVVRRGPNTLSTGWTATFASRSEVGG
jgi:hypothetical protein